MERDLPDHLREVATLRNRFIVVRHGHAESNAQGRIVSHPDHGVSGYGLTPEGLSQARRAGELLQKLVGGSPPTIVSSDFLRARQTAETLVASYGEPLPISFSPALRERYFGDFDLRLIEEVRPALSADAQAPFSKVGNVESVAEVLDRVTREVLRLDSLNTGATIVLVSHGDPLRIVECAFARISPARFREVAQYPHAQPKELILVARG